MNIYKLIVVYDIINKEDILFGFWFIKILEEYLKNVFFRLFKGNVKIIFVFIFYIINKYRDGNKSL